MSSLIRFTIIAVTALPAFAAIGCGPSKSEGQPNPDLKVPDVPPSGSNVGNKDMPNEKGKDKRK